MCMCAKDKCSPRLVVDLKLQLPEKNKLDGVIERNFSAESAEIVSYSPCFAVLRTMYLIKIRNEMGTRGISCEIQSTELKIQVLTVFSPVSGGTGSHYVNAG